MKKYVKNHLENAEIGPRLSRIRKSLERIQELLLESGHEPARPHYKIVGNVIYIETTEKGE